MEALTSRSGGPIGKAVGWILEAHFLSICLSLLVGGLGQTLGPGEVKSTRGRELRGTELPLRGACLSQKLRRATEDLTLVSPLPAPRTLEAPKGFK